MQLLLRLGFLLFRGNVPITDNFGIFIKITMIEHHFYKKNKHLIERTVQ